MPSHVSQRLDGKYTHGAPRQPVAPEDRAPQWTTVPASKIPAITTAGHVVEFASWVRWILIESSGGVVLLFTDTDGHEAAVKSGMMFYLPNRKVRVRANGTAPSSVVKLLGLSSEDAEIMSASATGAEDTAPVSPSTTSALITMIGYNGDNYDSVAVPGTGPRTVQIDLATDTPPGRNAPASVFVLSSLPSPPPQVVAPSGIIMLPGGTYLWPGGPAYITEVADIAGVNAYATVAYTS